jgi:hypothetical protein
MPSTATNAATLIGAAMADASFFLEVFAGLLCGMVGKAVSDSEGKMTADAWEGGETGAGRRTSCTV